MKQAQCPLCVHQPPTGAEVTHIGGHSTKRTSDRMLAEHHRSAYRYLADRHREVWWKPMLMAAQAGLKLRVKLLTRRR